MGRWLVPGVTLRSSRCILCRPSVRDCVACGAAPGGRRVSWSWGNSQDMPHPGISHRRIVGTSSSPSITAVLDLGGASLAKARRLGDPPPRLARWESGSQVQMTDSAGMYSAPSIGCEGMACIAFLSLSSRGCPSGHATSELKGKAPGLP